MEKSKGVTDTERMLAEFGERTFLKLWTYANPYKDDGHEMCDLIAVFGNDVFIFFDRQIVIDDSEDKDLGLEWDRWKRKAIDKQINTAHGVERYIRMGRPIFLDGKKAHPFPLDIDIENATFHKIIVAHGAKEACERESSDNVYGSLAITYVDTDLRDAPEFPFHVYIDRKKPVHVFDSHNLPIILTELDTVLDFGGYLREKLIAIAKYEMLSYCGEEDLLAHYLGNFDVSTNRHFIGTKDTSKVTGMMIGEGEWSAFIETDIYKQTKKANEISYNWDRLIQRTCQNALDGTLLGNSDIVKGKSAIYNMVKEPRFMRRGICEKLVNVIENFGGQEGQLCRQVTLLPSYTPKVAYVFLQFHAPKAFREHENYRSTRQTLLEIACGSAKNALPQYDEIIGIGIDAPKYSDGRDGEDFILMPCHDWTDEKRKYYEERNEPFQFFATPQLRRYEDTVHEFVEPTPLPRKTGHPPKVGRNDPCPCGSGTKFKKCHGKQGA
ncbi:hypothetical protein CH75_06940 [Dyella jiangningensis]|nr:hypothetical protein CH75_06940 [Dyella jiangningensis]